MIAISRPLGGDTEQWALQMSPKQWAFQMSPTEAGTRLYLKRMHTCEKRGAFQMWRFTSVFQPVATVETPLAETPIKPPRTSELPPPEDARRGRRRLKKGGQQPSMGATRRRFYSSASWPLWSKASAARRGAVSPIRAGDSIKVVRVTCLPQK